jgi:hypothetical protein
MLVGQLRRSEAPRAPLPAARFFLPTFLLTIVNPMTLVVFAGIVPQLPVAGSFASAGSLARARSVREAPWCSSRLQARAPHSAGPCRAKGGSAPSARPPPRICAFGIAGFARLTGWRRLQAFEEAHLSRRRASPRRCRGGGAPAARSAGH